jgi:hypothetical protein
VATILFFGFPYSAANTGFAHASAKLDNVGKDAVFIRVGFAYS